MRKTVLFLFFLFCFCVSTVSAQVGTWEFAGWYGGGCFTNLTFDPLAPGRVYLSSDVSGVYRSSDLGEHWTSMTKGLGQLMVAQVAVAPSDVRVVYAATATGIYVSRSAGWGWGPTSNPGGAIRFIRPESYRPVAIDAANPNRLCAGTSRGQVFCSCDAGATWEEITATGTITFNNKPIAAVLFKDSNTLYVGSGSGFFICRLDEKMCRVAPAAPTVITDMVTSSKDRRVVYAAGTTALWITRDGGSTWVKSQEIGLGKTYRVALDESTSPAIIRVLWINGWNGGVLISRDNGVSWQQQDANMKADSYLNPTRAWAAGGGRSTGLSVSPFYPNVIFRTDWWGVWRSDDGGASWNEKLRGAPDSVVTHISAQRNGDLYVSSMDNGLMRSRDGGRSYEMLFPKKYDPQTAGHVWQVALAGNRIIAASSPWNKFINQMILSDDDGENFALTQQGLPASRPVKDTLWGQGYPRGLAVDPKNPNIIYMGMDGQDGGGLYVSRDAGRTWTRSAGQPQSLRVYKGLAVDPTNSSRIIWGAAGPEGGVYISEDGGARFTRVFQQMVWVFAVAVGPDGTIYAAGDGGGAQLYASRDHGHSWKLIGSFDKGRALVSIAIDPNRPNRVAVGTTSWSNSAPSKVYMTVDGGGTWQDVTGNLPDGPGIATMTFDATSQYLYAGRSGSSVYRLPL